MTSQFPTAAPAATVILARPSGADFEVYLLKRSADSRFMAGNFVFPGGKVDRVDGEAEKWFPHVDMDLETISQRLGGGLDAREAMAYGVAAIRETFEEAGVFLGSRNATGSDGQERVNRLRETGDYPPGWFRDFVSDQPWCLELARLKRWAHWVTPLEMKRHYDTRYFVADMPPDQTCRPDDLETTQGLWISPREGLEANMADRIRLSPPTVVTLQALSKYKNHDALKKEIEDRPWGKPLRPRFLKLARGAMIIEPWDPEFGAADIVVDPDQLDDKLLPAGTDFSRIWMDQGLWRPVAV